MPGARFPDYVLTDHTRVERRLSDLQGVDPMIVTLARGHFCPKEHIYHRELASFYPALSMSYVSLVTISTDIIIDCGEFRAAVGAHWPILADPDRIVLRDLDIAEYTDPWHDPMIPHVFVLGPGLEIFRIYNGYWYVGRPSPDDLRRDLRELSVQCRPDWDIQAPELHEAYERGDLRRHWPYTEHGLSDLWPEVADIPHRRTQAAPS